MRLCHLLVTCGLLAGSISLTRAADGEEATTVKHRIMVAAYEQGTSRLLEIGEDGKPTWEHKLPPVSVIFHPCLLYTSPSPRDS